MYTTIIVLLATLLSIAFGEANNFQRNTSHPLLTTSPNLNPSGLPYFLDVPDPYLHGPETGCPSFSFHITNVRDYDVGQMIPTPQTTAKSPYHANDLSPWGYSMYGAVDSYRNFKDNGYWGIAPWLRDAGVSDKAGVYVRLTIKWQTGAYFHMAVTAEGDIMTQNRKFPWSALQEVHPTDHKASKLPEMQRSSDMMWAQWEFHVPEDKRSNIQFFITVSIENPTTLALMRRALNERGKELTRKVERFEMSTDQGKALLSTRREAMEFKVLIKVPGSPNGAGFAHFLIQRKAEVGLKQIEAVWVFECSTGSKTPCLFFTVEDLAQPVPRPSNTGPQPNSTPGDDPIAKGDAENARSGKEEPAMVKPRDVEKRNFVRVHTFRLGDNVTLSSEYI
ncbi:hypothetical protein CC86DRAFT_414326 [Ophiobolus disseminans]|uniref:Uncharacterized protein n=1 Tax=Ophiobolus disseminans TaxID=1469910 RepID=A0A6A7AHT4_9PLEO|nr:hypothetical protein CC86DRAFT_414326 [Ophiobolus disseminans]